MFVVFTLTEHCKVWLALQRDISKMGFKKPMKNVVLNLAVVLKMYFIIAFLLKNFQNSRTSIFPKSSNKIFWLSEVPVYKGLHLQRFTNFPGKNTGRSLSISMMQLFWKRNRSLLSHSRQQVYYSFDSNENVEKQEQGHFVKDLSNLFRNDNKSTQKMLLFSCF